MKKIFAFLAITVAIPVLLMAFKPQEPKGPTTDQYILIAWNDLGMHLSLIHI